jgi:hypothetical protein
MPRLGAKERAQLPDSAFAYVDSLGRRRLPIHDASHVRNALARFNQVIFEGESARDRARSRLLRAAQEGVGLRSLGAWRFRGLPEPLVIFQVDAHDLPTDFPPLRSAIEAGQPT